MSKRLNGGTGTGQKIIENFNLFSFSLNEDKTNRNEGFYSFVWAFGNQHGYVSITIKDTKISNGSLIDTDSDSPYSFKRPLGIYNDDSLCAVLKKLLEIEDVKIDGVYEKNWL